MKSRILTIFCAVALSVGASCLPSGGSGGGGNNGEEGSSGGVTSSSCTPAESERCQVFEIVNIERDQQGLEPLEYNSALEDAAQLHAEDMRANDYFSHDSQDGRNFVDRINDAGYSGVPGGENIAWGQRSSEQVMDGWMNSDGHRANILNAGFDEIGVGYADPYWVPVFGRR